MSTTLIRANGSNVTPANDAKLYQRKFNDCLFEDVTITTLGADQLSVPALYGMIQGRDFNIDAQTFTATLADSGTVTGYILVQIDLTTDELISLTAELDPYTPTYDDLNASGSVAEMIIATYEADTTQVTSITMTADVYEQDVHNLAENTDEWDDATQYAADDYVVYHGTLYQANTTPTLGTWDSTEWDRVDLTTLKNDLMQISTGIRYNETDETIEIEVNGSWVVWRSNVGAHIWDALTNNTTWNLGDSGVTVTISGDQLVVTSSGLYAANKTAIVAGNTLHAKGTIYNTSPSSHRIGVSTFGSTSQGSPEVDYVNETLASGNSYAFEIETTISGTGYLTCFSSSGYAFNVVFDYLYTD